MVKLFRGAAVAAALSVMSVGPAAALTAKDKMTTCKFGADDQKLQGKARTSFMAKCMSNEKSGARPVAKPVAKPAAKPAG